MKAPAIRTEYLNTMQYRAKEGRSFPQVRVVSYHIPKAAGTSMANALIDAFGRRATLGIYRKSKLRDRLTQGRPVWIPSHIKVLHGMFMPHPIHHSQFPNARFVTWVRDPSARLSSLLSYWMAHDEKHDAQWLRFKAKYPSSTENDKTKLLEFLATDEEFEASNRYYASFFRNVDPGFFDFVGRIEKMEDDKSALNRSLGVSLTLPHANKGRTSTIEAPLEIADHLKSETELIKTFLPHEH